MNPSSAEALLLARIARGDQGALDVLYALYRPRLWRYLQGLLASDAGQIEEIMQDVFLAVWHRAATFRGESSVAAWIFSIARHQLHNARRHAQRRPEGHSESLLVDAEGEHRSDGQEPSLEEVVVARLALAEALARLSPHHREVLDLAFHHGFSLDEMATILHVPLGTIKSRMHAARRALAISLDAVEEVVPHDR